MGPKVGLHVLVKINISLAGIKLRSSVAQRSHCTKVTAGAHDCFLRPCANFSLQQPTSRNVVKQTPTNAAQRPRRENAAAYCRVSRLSEVCEE